MPNRRAPGKDGGGQEERWQKQEDRTAFSNWVNIRAEGHRCRRSRNPPCPFAGSTCAAWHPCESGGRCHPPRVKEHFQQGTCACGTGRRRLQNQEPATF